MSRNPALLVALCLLVAATLVPLAESASERAVKVNIKKRDPQGGAPSATGSDDDPSRDGVQVRPVAGSGRRVDVSFNVQDENGHNDVKRASVTVYKGDKTTQHLSATSGTKSAGSGRTATWDFTFNMNYWDAPGEYWIRADAEDRDGSVTTQWVNFTYERTAAVGLSTSSVSLNPDANDSLRVNPGGDTLSQPSNVSILNKGNVQVDLQYQGIGLTNATHGITIDVSNVWLSVNSNMSERVALGGSAATMSTFDLLPGETSSRPVYLAIAVPKGVPSGAYTGEITLAAVSAS